MTDSVQGTHRDPPWELARAIFVQAVEMPGSAQAAFLDEACARDEELRALVLRLLSADRTDGPLDRPLQEVADALDEGAEPNVSQARPGERVGPYRLVEVLGTGGMGEVWRAEQEEPVRRDVAVKLVRGGLDADEVVARFEAERQALALMNHPSIARVFDAGSTEDGRPYFAMELIRGAPITEYADLHRLDTRQRVRLLATVCRAVQHAHQKGVIHRDLKPSNVLVTVAGDEPHPKVIDFGIAKATGGTRTGRTLHTRVGQVVGTPQYMSPEQAEMTGLDIDTRTDVYALGVLLYELLVGTLPYDRALYSKPDFLIVHFLRETDTPRPSHRLETLADTQRTVARNRSTPIAELRRQLKGDLDWIVLRAMDKDRSRRYATASELAADLERYVAGEPVLARPPSLGYRLSRLVRRNRAAVAAAMVAATALVGGTAAATVGLVRARAAEGAARDAQLRAQREADTSQAVSNFLASLFATQTPAQTMGREMTARELLQQGERRVREELSGQPSVQAQVFAAIGDVYQRLGMPEAVPLLEEALAIRERERGPDAPEVASSILVLARALSGAGSNERRAALLERALAIYEAQDGPGSIGAIRARQSLASAYQASGRFEEAEELLLEAEAAIGELPPALPIAEAEYLKPDALLALSRGSMAALYGAQGRFEEQRTSQEEAVVLLEEALEPGHPYLVSGYHTLARLYRSQERTPEARDLLERVLEATERVYGPWNANTATALLALGEAEQDLGRLDDAERRFARAAGIADSVFGAGSPRVADALVNLGFLDLARGEPPAAEEWFRKAASIYGSEGPFDGQISAYRGLATALDRQRRPEDAVVWSERAAAASIRLSGWGNPVARGVRDELSRRYLALGRPDVAAQVHLEAFDSIRARFGDGSLQLGLAAREVAAFHKDAGELTAALEWVDRASDELRSAPNGWPELVYTLRFEIEILTMMGAFDEALSVRREAIEADEASGDTWNLVVDLQYTHWDYDAAGRAEEARPHQARALDLLLDYLAGVKDTTRVHLTYVSVLAMRTGEIAVARDAFEAQLGLLRSGADDYLAIMIGVRAGYEDALAGLGDDEARLANFQAAIDAYDAAPEHQRAYFLDDERRAEWLRELYARYATLLRVRGRDREAAEMVRRAESTQPPPAGEP